MHPDDRGRVIGRGGRTAKACARSSRHSPTGGASASTSRTTDVAVRRTGARTPRPRSVSSANRKTQLRVGRLVKAHGLKGALKLELYTDDPEGRFMPGASFTLQVPESSPWHGKTLTVREFRWMNSHPVAFFEGVDDRTAAEELVRAILWIDQDDEDIVVEDDAWYDHQLVGLDVVRDDQRRRPRDPGRALPGAGPADRAPAGRPRGPGAVRQGDRPRRSTSRPDASSSRRPPGCSKSCRATTTADADAAGSADEVRVTAEDGS